MQRWQSTRDTAGFALIELLIVVVITGVIAAISVPNLLESRRSANGASAVEATRLFHSTQVTYQAGVGNSSFGSATNLFEQDFIDSVLAGAWGVAVGTVSKSGNEVRPEDAGGRRWGYIFRPHVSEDLQHFTMEAFPAVPGRTGDRAFYIDETGRLDIRCPPGTVFNPLTRECEADDSYLDSRAFAAIRGLDILTDGKASTMAMDYLQQNPGVVGDVLVLLDCDGDGVLTLAEMLNVKFLDYARKITRTAAPPSKSTEDKLVDGVLRKLDTQLTEDLALGIALEGQPRGLPLSQLKGDVAGFLRRYPPTPVKGQ